MYVSLYCWIAYWFSFNLVSSDVNEMLCCLLIISMVFVYFVRAHFDEGQKRKQWKNGKEKQHQRQSSKCCCCWSTRKLNCADSIYRYRCRCHFFHFIFVLSVRTFMHDVPLTVFTIVDWLSPWKIAIEFRRFFFHSPFFWLFSFSFLTFVYFLYVWVYVHVMPWNTTNNADIY